MQISQELRTLEAVTFEVHDVGFDDSMMLCWSSSSCSTSSCCSCSTSSCTSCSTSTGGPIGCDAVEVTAGLS